MRSIEKILFTPIAEDQGWFLYRRISLHGRTLIVWQNPMTEMISICLFTYLGEPNEFSKKMRATEWGSPTYFVNDITSVEEAAKLFELYAKDFREQNFWWEEEN